MRKRIKATFTAFLIYHSTNNYDSEKYACNKPTEPCLEDKPNPTLPKRFKALWEEIWRRFKRKCPGHT